MPLQFSCPVLSQPDSLYSPMESDYVQFEGRLRARTSITPSVSVSLPIQYHLRGFSDAEKLNFLALIQKSWPHLIFIAGIQSTSRVQFSVWRTYNGHESNLSEAVSQYTQHFRDRIQIFLGDPTAVVMNLLKSDSGIPAIMSFVRRVPMLADWASKYSTETKLTSTATLKWETFEEITKFGRRGILARPARQSVTESDPDDDEPLPDEDE